MNADHSKMTTTDAPNATGAQIEPRAGAPVGELPVERALIEVGTGDEREAFYLRQPQAAPTAQHPDDVTAWLAVDLFAAAMKAKLAASRLRGRSGWDDPAQCEVNYLADCLIDHCGKVNSAVDIANFAMMICRRTDGKDHGLIPEASKAARLKWEAERQAAPTSSAEVEGALKRADGYRGFSYGDGDSRALIVLADALRAAHQAPPTTSCPHGDRIGGTNCRYCDDPSLTPPAPQRVQEAGDVDV